jgi:hypothetical protein
MVKKSILIKGLGVALAGFLVTITYSMIMTVSPLMAIGGFIALTGGFWMFFMGLWLYKTNRIVKEGK